MRLFSLIALIFGMTTPSRAGHFLLPVPSSVQWQSGVFNVSPRFNVGISGPKDSRVDGAVQRFLGRLGGRIGSKLSVGGGIDASLLIETKNAGLPVQSYSEDESYALLVEATRIHLSADNALGVMHGLETILQLLEKRGKVQVLQAVTIKDSPRFRWRGLLIDACRHWQPLEVIRRNIDGLAAAKMNVLHWHLSEDQGVRVESKVYPRLQELASDGNFYTQEEIKGLVAYARERGVRVLPEFDMPGHTTGFQAAYPELGSAKGPFPIERKYGVFNPTLDPTREEVFTFIDGFLGEMAGLFPDAFMHIGGDENNGEQWNQNQAIQSFMREKGYKTNDDLQAYFSGRVSKILTKHGKQMVGWDEILQLELPAGTVVHAWRSPELLASSTKRGYDTILSNGYYLDLAHPASDHYLREPIPADQSMTAEQIGHVIGGEACMWSELVSMKTIDSRIWPRSLAVAERLWSDASVRDLPDFYRRMDKVSVDLEELGLTHRSNKLAMLKDLAGAGDVAALTTLADSVAPLQNYSRHESRVYTQSTPLDRLVDAVEPDSQAVRNFSSQVEAFLTAKAGSKSLEELLTRWAGNHKLLGPMLEKSERLTGVAPLSSDLSDLGALGLEAHAALKTGKLLDKAWQDKAAKILKRAAEPKAELEFGVLTAMKKLVLAAGQK